MAILKHIPEDFIVEEQPEFTLAPGPFTILKITKRNRNTEDVASELAQKLHLSRKLIGYAGTKDKQAVTIQYFSIKQELKQPMTLSNCKTQIVGTSKEPLRLGMLKANKFIITLRDTQQLNLPQSIPNYFDEQRFGTDNAKIGVHLLKKEFKQATQKINQHSQYNLDETQPINALQTLPRQLTKLYLHAAQSLLWNRIVANYIQTLGATNTVEYSQGILYFPKEKLIQQEIPMPGFGVEYGDFEIAANNILQEENLNSRDFVIRQLPNLSLEGTQRKLLIDITDLNIQYAPDDIFTGKQKAIITFTLPKGSYATMVVKTLLR